MIILIGGTGCTGKTLFAARLMQKTKIPYFPLDHLMMGIYRGMPNCGFSPMDGQADLAEKMWPVIQGIIMTNIENEHNLILEGVQLLPRLVNDFPPEYLPHILPIFLFFSENYIHENYESKILKHRSVIENRSGEDEMTPAELIHDTRLLKEQCVQYGITFFEIEDNYEAKMKAAEDTILVRIS